MSGSSIPNDLILDLLLRLPPQSLLRFRCVSKSWRALIDSPKFVAVHLTRSLSDPRAHQYVFRGYVQGPFKIYAARFDSVRNFNLTLGTLKDPPISSPYFWGSKLVGSCNGLLCVEYAYSRIILWNPWVRKFVKVPYSQFQSKSSRGPVSHGFGYDDTTDDYKVVRLDDATEDCKGPWFDPYGSGCGIQLYSLKSNSWRNPRTLPCSFSSRVRGRAGVLVNRALHWIVNGGGILAIDLRTEEYRLMEKPEFLERNYCCWELGSLDGCLCLFPKEFPLPSSLASFSAGIWVMKDYGIEDSWTQLSLRASSAGHSSAMCPIGYAERNTQLVLQNDQGDVLWYDIRNSELVARSKFPGSSGVKEGYSCVASLVLPYGGGGNAMKCTQADIISDVWS